MKKYSLAFLLLLFLLVAQGSVFYLRTAKLTGPPSVPEGTNISEVSFVNEDGEVALLDVDETTILLTFSSTCSVCERIVPVWNELRPESKIKTIAVTSEDVDVGKDYIKSIDDSWDLEVISIPVEKLGSIEHMLLAKTPWIFVIDSEENIVYQGHGSLLEEVLLTFKE